MRTKQLISVEAISDALENSETVSSWSGYKIKIKEIGKNSTGS
jgi:hypothetical protein